MFVASLWMRLLLGVCLLVLAPVGRAQDEISAEMQSRLDNVRYQTGTVVLPQAMARIDVPAGWRFLSLEEVAKVYQVEHYNLRESVTLGWLLPGKTRFEDDNAWSVDLSYFDDGHVGEDPERLDPYRLTWRMRDVYRWANTRQGYYKEDRFEFVNFARTPVFDRNQHICTWSERIRYPDDGGKELLDIYAFAFSRQGGIEIDATYMPGDWQDEVEAAVESLVRSIRFDVGERYEDYTGSDALADYEMSHLVTAEVWIGPQTWSGWLTQPVSVKLPLFKRTKLRLDVPNWVFWGGVMLVFFALVVRWIKGGTRAVPKFKPRGARR